MRIRYLILNSYKSDNVTADVGRLVGSSLFADIFTRYCRLTNNETFFIGIMNDFDIVKNTDGIMGSHKKYCNQMYQVYENIHNQLDIKYNIFGRTASDRHIKLVHEVFNYLFTKNMLIEEAIDKFFCEKCNVYYDAAMCQACQRLVEAKTIYNLYLEIVQNNSSKYKIYITDSSTIGINVPYWLDMRLHYKYENKMLHNTFQALISYISINYFDLQYWWECKNDVIIVQFITKNDEDIERYCKIFPMLLQIMGKNVSPYKTLLIPEIKMGNVIDLLEDKLVNNDIVRLFLLNEYNTIETITEFNNQTLVNNVGKYVNYVLNNMIANKSELSKILHNTFDVKINKLIDEYHSSMENLKFKKAFKIIIKTATYANSLASNDSHVLTHIHILYKICRMLAPFIPSTSSNILKDMGISEHLQDLYFTFDKLNIDNISMDFQPKFVLL